MNEINITLEQIDNELEEYWNYDFESFDSLSIDKKIGEHTRLCTMLLKRKRFRHWYLKKLEKLSNENKIIRIRIEGKILHLAKLLDILECVINQMEIRIILK